MIRLTPRTSPTNAEYNLPWVRRKRLKEAVCENPEMYGERFQDLLEQFRKKTNRLRRKGLSHRDIGILLTQLKQISKDLLDYLEIGVFDFDTEFYMEVRKRVQKFL